MHFLFFSGLSQPVMCLICYLKSHSFNHGDTCWVGGNPHVHPEPHSVTCRLGHMHSAGAAPRSVLWVEGGSIHWTWVWEQDAENPSQEGKEAACTKPPVHATLFHWTLLTILRERELLRTPYGDCKALNPQIWGPLLCTVPLTMGPCVATHSCRQS